MKKALRITATLLLLFCIAAIFLFSAQTSRDSGNLSKGVTKELLTIVKPSFTELSEPEQRSVVNVVFVKIRKLAHFTLFGGLGAVSMCVLTLWDDKDIVDSTRNQTLRTSAMAAQGRKRAEQAGVLAAQGRKRTAQVGVPAARSRKRVMPNETWADSFRHRRGLLIHFIISVFFCFLYACTDEFHQLFVDGRGAQLKDVMLDTAGAFCGAMAMTALIVIVQFFMGKRRGKHALRPTCGKHYNTAGF